MKRDKDWQKFEDLIAQKLKAHDPYAMHTKGSRYGDIKTSCGLHIECKNSGIKKSMYNEEYMQKCIEEVPLHSENIPILFTKNKDGKMRAHLDLDDFLDLYFSLLDHQTRGY